MCCNSVGDRVAVVEFIFAASVLYRSRSSGDGLMERRRRGKEEGSEEDEDVGRTVLAECSLPSFVGLCQFTLPRASQSSATCTLDHRLICPP